MIVIKVTQIGLQLIRDYRMLEMDICMVHASKGLYHASKGLYPAAALLVFNIPLCVNMMLSGKWSECNMTL